MHSVGRRPPSSRWLQSVQIVQVRIHSSFYTAETGHIRGGKFNEVLPVLGYAAAYTDHVCIASQASTRSRQHIQLLSMWGGLIPSSTFCPDVPAPAGSGWQQASDHGRAAGCPDWGEASQHTPSEALRDQDGRLDAHRLLRDVRTCITPLPRPPLLLSEWDEA